MSKQQQKQQQQEEINYYSSSSEISLDDLEFFKPLGESALDCSSEDEEELKGNKEGLITMLKTLSLIRKEIIQLPDDSTYSPYSSPPPPRIESNYNNQKGKGRDITLLGNNLYSEPTNYFGSSSSTSSGSTSPGSVISYNSTSTSPMSESNSSSSPHSFSSVLDQSKVFNPSSSPTTSSSIYRPVAKGFSLSSTTTPSTERIDNLEGGLIGNFNSKMSPNSRGRSDKINSSSSNIGSRDEFEIEGVALRVKFPDSGFAF